MGFDGEPTTGWSILTHHGVPSGLTPSPREFASDFHQRMMYSGCAQGGGNEVDSKTFGYSIKIEAGAAEAP